MKLSILDQSPIAEGATPQQAVSESIALARLADRLGYHRYWVAEHHSTSGLAGSTPEILIARLAAETRHLRVGSGGVMLSHYSALKVAENFRMLEALYPGRIDLGIGRAPGSDGRTAQALAHGPGKLGIEYFPRQIKDLSDFLTDRIGPDHPFHGIHAEPRGPGQPELWLLGSSDQSAAYAAYFGLPFSFAHFINDEGGAEVMAAYRQQFRPSAGCPEPKGSIGVFCIAAPTAEEAEHLALSRDLWLLRLRTGRTGPVPTPAEALAYPYSDPERHLVNYNRRRTIAGTAEQVKMRLLQLGAEYGVAEFVVVSVLHDYAKRRRSYELLAEAFGLVPAAAAAAD